MHGPLSEFALQLPDNRGLDGAPGRIAVGYGVLPAPDVVIAPMAMRVLRSTTGGDGEDADLLEAVPAAADIRPQENLE